VLQGLQFEVLIDFSLMVLEEQQQPIVVGVESEAVEAFEGLQVVVKMATVVT